MVMDDSAGTLMSRIEQTEKSLRAQLRLPQPDEKTVKPLRTSLIALYEALITLHHVYSAKSQAEQSLWKLGFYKRIDEFRKRHARMSEALTNPEKRQRASQALDTLNTSFTRFLDKSVEFYGSLMGKLAAACDLKVPGYSDQGFSVEEVARFRGGAGDLSCMIASCQRCLIYMGDLERYRALYLFDGSPDWTAAEGHYITASRLTPEAGNPHNQIAVLNPEPQTRDLEP